ncbi:hypothetical protein CRE_25818 [Caenorhabditis remanei]|uniref:Uncharacterized protein n=1 Tax=Caenorhabditis remanei TaxID=31234 RepID=E3NA85_CAERE|nr:hypothetical protein CRE_25818 [Caenorhabditis remanei]
MDLAKRLCDEIEELNLEGEYQQAEIFRLKNEVSHCKHQWSVVAEHRRRAWQLTDEYFEENNKLKLENEALMEKLMKANKELRELKKKLSK